MNFNQLQYFILVGKYENISQAAREIHVSQPTISDAVRALEKELGISLFHRVKNRLSLTEEGRYYHERVSSIVGNLEQLNQEMILLGSNEKVVRFGIPPMTGTIVFPHVIEGFEKYYPNISLELNEGGSLELLEELMNDQIDIAIISLPDNAERDYSNLSYQKILNTEIKYCVSKSHRFANRTEIDVAELSGEKIIMYNGGYTISEYITKAFCAVNINPKILLRIGQLSTIKDLVRRNFGATFLFSDVINESDDIIQLPLKQIMPVELYLVWKNYRASYRDVKIFSKFFKEYPLQNF